MWFYDTKPFCLSDCMVFIWRYMADWVHVALSFSLLVVGLTPNTSNVSLRYHMLASSHWSIAALPWIKFDYIVVKSFFVEVWSITSTVNSMSLLYESTSTNCACNKMHTSNYKKCWSLFNAKNDDLSHPYLRIIYESRIDKSITTIS